jgi:hypothetical protein
MALNVQQIHNAKISVMTTSTTVYIPAVPRTPVPLLRSILMGDVMELSALLILNVKTWNVDLENVQRVAAQP